MIDTYSVTGGRKSHQNVRIDCHCTGCIAPAPSQGRPRSARQQFEQALSHDQNDSEQPVHSPALQHVETQLGGALEAGTGARLQAAIRYAVRAIAAANLSTVDLSKVRHALACHRAGVHQWGH